MYHLGSSFIGISFSSELRDLTQQPAQKRVNARYNRKESRDDNENYARRLQNRGEFGPRYSFELGESFLKLCPYAAKPIGSLVLRFCCVCHSLPLCATRNSARFFGLFGLFVFGVLLAERTVFVENQSVGIVLFVLNAVVISVLAFRALERDFSS